MKISSIFKEALRIAKEVEDKKLKLRPVVTALQAIKAGSELKEAKSTSILKLISGYEKITLSACDGKATIAKAEKTFTGYIDDSNLKRWGLDKPGKKAGSVDVGVHELQQAALVKQMFDELDPDMDKLCLEQEQIIEFVEKKRNWLRTDGYEILFLFKCGDKFFVAVVGSDPDGTLGVLIRWLKRGNICSAGYMDRLVVPQLQTV